MAETRLPRTGTPYYSTGSDTQLSRADWNEFAQSREDTTALYAQGTRAARPAAGKAGRYYWATDEQAVYYDNGAAWFRVADAVSNRVALFSDAGVYAAMTPGAVNTSSLLGTITLPGPSAILVRAFSALGFDVAGQAWTLAVGVRLTPATTGTAQADYAGTAAMLSAAAGSVTCEVLTPILAADTYEVRSYVKAVTGTSGSGVAFTNPRLTLETKRAL